jgi:hypothetical protein
MHDCRWEERIEELHAPSYQESHSTMSTPAKYAATTPLPVQLSAMECTLSLRAYLAMSAYSPPCTFGSHRAFTSFGATSACPKTRNQFLLSTTTTSSRSIVQLAASSPSISSPVGNVVCDPRPHERVPLPGPVWRCAAGGDGGGARSPRARPNAVQASTAATPITHIVNVVPMHLFLARVCLTPEVRDRTLLLALVCR